jgi:aerobic-type carbon monoxide dehydrogenase small subunit (CoxS/CutS family)
MIKLNINGQERDIDMDPDTPLLWALRDGLQLTGTKYGCGIAQCGACVVLADGKPIRSCVTAISSLSGKQLVTIEGLSTDRSHPVQQAWIKEEVPQCGYCQSGQILSTVALLENNPSPSDADIDDALGDVLCRCGTYPRIRKAIKSLAVQVAQQDEEA